ncbi:hypothetical protein MTO96_040800 [Rhipicephalus appendiculatus]
MIASSHVLRETRIPGLHSHQLRTAGRPAASVSQPAMIHAKTSPTRKGRRIRDGVADVRHATGRPTNCPRCD